MFWFYDYYYIVLVVPMMILAFWAQWNVQHTFKKYSKELSYRGMTGHDAARRILDANGLHNVAIVRVAGDLTDHYDPRTNTVNLSQSVYDSTSVAAIGVAAHEVGHAVQHAVGYVPIKIRMAIIPVTQFASTMSMPLVLIGLLLAFPGLALIGCAFFGMATVFQLVTLPVEFNASRRAMKTLEETRILSGKELDGSRNVLSAAAMTYVAALAVSLAQLLRLLLIVGGGNRRD